MRADRLLSILFQLQLHTKLTGRELAERLEVSERTIHRDMEALGNAGVPVVAERGTGGGWSLMEGYRTNLTGLSEPEVRALFVTRPARLLADLHLEEASDAALIKLLTVLPAVYRRNAELARQRILIDVTGWTRPSDRVLHLPLLQDAVWRERKVRITYGDKDPHVRLAGPLGLVAKGSIWYLVAEVDGDVRTYRVSRVQDVEILDEPFVRPEGFDLARFWEESAVRFKERLPRYEAVIRAEPSALPWIQAMIRFGGIDNVTEEAGLARISMHFDTEEVARAVLLGFGDRVEVLAPPSLRDGILAAARALLSRSGE
jgi:predicted DNA-binding transcriptional regulator YafY